MAEGRRGAPQEGTALSPASRLCRPPGSVIRTAPGAAPVVAVSLPLQVRTGCSSRSWAPPMRSGVAAAAPWPTLRPLRAHAAKPRHALHPRRTRQPSPSATQAINGGLETTRSRMTRMIPGCGDGAITDMRPAQVRGEGGNGRETCELRGGDDHPHPGAQPTTGLIAAYPSQRLGCRRRDFLADCADRHRAAARNAGPSLGELRPGDAPRTSATDTAAGRSRRFLQSPGEAAGTAISRPVAPGGPRPPSETSAPDPAGLDGATERARPQPAVPIRRPGPRWRGARVTLPDPPSA